MAESNVVKFPSNPGSALSLLQQQIAREIEGDAPAIARGIFGDSANHPDMSQISNGEYDGLIRAAYLREDRQWLQQEAQRDPQQFLDSTGRLGVQVTPKQAAAAPPQQPPLPVPSAQPQQSPIPVAPPQVPPAAPLPAPAPIPAPVQPTIATPNPPPVILGPNGQPLPPSIPQMAAGGIVTQPTLAVIGERGPEAVVPLQQPTFMAPNQPAPLPLTVNIDPKNPTARPNPTTGYGMDEIGGVRAVSRNDPDQNAYLDALKAAGKQVMSVVTPESKGFVYGKSDSLQIGNEPDSSGPSSSPMTPQDYANMWNTYRAQYAGKVGQFVLGGLGSGLGNAKAYLDQVWPMLQTKPDAVALHLYDGDVNQSLAEIQDIQQELQRLGSNAQVMVTEWNRPGQEWAMQNMFQQQGIPWASYFPYSTAQQAGTPGVVNAQGRPTTQGASLVSSVLP